MQLIESDLQVVKARVPTRVDNATWRGIDTQTSDLTMNLVWRNIPSVTETRISESVKDQLDAWDVDYYDEVD